MAPYRYDDAQWQNAVKEAKLILAERARRGQTISYSELAGFIKSISFSPDGSHFAALLGDLSNQEDKKGRGMLSVLVVHKGGDLKPGKGFFELAYSLGRKGDELEVWSREFEKVTDFWKRA